jgi:hypothetical protein
MIDRQFKCRQPYKPLLTSDPERFHHSHLCSIGRAGYNQLLATKGYSQWPTTSSPAIWGHCFQAMSWLCASRYNMSGRLLVRTLCHIRVLAFIGSPSLSAGPERHPSQDDWHYFDRVLRGRHFWDFPHGGCVIDGWSALGGLAMGETWKSDLERWLAPFLNALRHKVRRGYVQPMWRD